jgi:hypothetical protein
MPAPILTQAAVIMCPHGGQSVVVPQNPTVQIMGSPVLVVTDVFTVVGCPFNISGAPAPCVNIQWTMPAVSVMVNNVPVLLQTSVGMCMGGSGAVPAIIVHPGQVQVLGS